MWFFALAHDFQRSRSSYPRHGERDSSSPSLYTSSSFLGAARLGGAGDPGTSKPWGQEEYKAGTKYMTASLELLVSDSDWDGHVKPSKRGNCNLKHQNCYKSQDEVAGVATSCSSLAAKLPALKSTTRCGTTGNKGGNKMRSLTLKTLKTLQGVPSCRGGVRRLLPHSLGETSLPKNAVSVWHRRQKRKEGEDVAKRRRQMMKPASAQEYEKRKSVEGKRRGGRMEEVNSQENHPNPRRGVLSLPQVRE